MDSDAKNLYKNLENELIGCNTLVCFSRKVLNALKKILGFERGGILIYNPELKELELVAETGLQSNCRLSRFKINDEEVFSIPLSVNGVAFGVLQFFSEKETEEKKRESRSGIDLENLAEWLGERIYRIIRLESVKNDVYRKLLEYAGFIAVVDNEGFILDCSTSFERILGYSHGELIGFNIKEIHKGYLTNSEAILMRKNGTSLTCYESTEVIVDRDGKTSGFIKIFSLDKDVESNDTDKKLSELENKRKEALEKIKENLEYFELLADKLINPIAIMRGSIELKDEIKHDKIFSTLIQQIERINQILEEFRRREKETFRIWTQLNNRHKFHKK